MAGDLNKVIMTGRLVSDPELKQTTTGFSVVESRIAVKRKFVKEGGQDVDFISFVAKRHHADFLSRYFRKGDRIAIVGELHNEEYRDNAGNKRNFVKVDDVEVYSLKEFRGENAQSGANEGQQGYDAPQFAKNNSPTFEQLRGGDDDLPF